MSRQFFYKNTKHELSVASLTDTTAPTFAGVTSVTQNSNGSLTANATAATDISNPIRYELYISTTNIGLFNTSNISLVSYSLPMTVYTDSSGDLLVYGDYYIGLRAVDAVGNRETNTVTIQETSLGVPDYSVIDKLNQILANTNLIPATL